ncbi:flavin reductase family protein [Halomonas sp. QX-2]|uniref:Flavin reductase family protein n=1 Tax=Vreelandella sedimenti TaxID=2729618 RepID=A0A7Z0N8B9_9GAMM|nr:MULTISPECIES: flavin reductase family protein [Halomonas]NYT73514.1 flavin reductase family protein [Halomonas sedimenti]
MARISVDNYKRVLGSFPSGVTVVTALTADGKMVGFTASAFSAVSLDPPLILVCPSLASETYQAICQSGRFTVHILGYEQEKMAYQFASKMTDKSAGIEWQRSSRGNAIINGAAAYLECRLWENYPGGDHAIVVGEVEHLQVEENDPEPLLYYRGAMSRVPKTLVDAAILQA